MACQAFWLWHERWSYWAWGSVMNGMPYAQALCHLPPAVCTTHWGTGQELVTNHQQKNSTTLWNIFKTQLHLLQNTSHSKSGILGWTIWTCQFCRLKVIDCQSFHMVKCMQRSLMAGKVEFYRSSSEHSDNSKMTGDNLNTEPGHTEAKWFSYNRMTV